MKYLNDIDDITYESYLSLLNSMIDLSTLDVSTSNGSTFWKSNNKIILEKKPSNIIWVNYDIWMNFSNSHTIFYDDTQLIMKDWLEESLNVGELFPQMENKMIKTEWDNL